MTRRDRAPNVPEIKDMEFHELLIEQPRLMKSIRRMDSVRSRDARAERALQFHLNSLESVRAEIAVRIDEDPLAFQTLFLTLMTETQAAAEIYLEAPSAEALDDLENAVQRVRWFRR